jgi:PH (Pleckstrin Homology) domain-containing protein
MPEPPPDESDAPVPTEVTWRVDKRLTVGKWAGAAIFVLAAAIGFRDPAQLIVVGVAALLLVVLGLRDVIAPVRLAAGPEGVTVVTGFAGRRTIAWNAIDHIKVDARRGMLLRSQVLELDAGDQLYFFSVNELGMPCDAVADTLQAMRVRFRSGR